MTEAALRKAVGKGLAGETVPPCVKVGRKVVFPREAVDYWYATLAERSLAECGLLSQNDDATKRVGRPIKGRPTPAERRNEIVRKKQLISKMETNHWF